VKIASRGTMEFWRLYRALPGKAQATARKNYQLWQDNAFHPSLHFKPIGKPNWSVRVGDHYRAIGRFVGLEFVWEWIGTHADYNQRFQYPFERDRVHPAQSGRNRRFRGLVQTMGCAHAP